MTIWLRNSASIRRRASRYKVTRTPTKSLCCAQVRLLLRNWRLATKLDKKNGKAIAGATLGKKKGPLAEKCHFFIWLVLLCIDADFCNQILIFQLFF